MRLQDALARLIHHRWTLPILAELHQHQGDRFAALANRLGTSRETLSQTLIYLIRHRLVRRNPGYGHPLRPEYLLASKGERIAPRADQLLGILRLLDAEEFGLRKWTIPLLYTMGETNRPCRFNELGQSFTDVTPRALSEVLKELHMLGWVTREVTDEFPPSTRYRLAPAAKRIVSAIRHLADALAPTPRSRSRSRS